MELSDVSSQKKRQGQYDPAVDLKPEPVPGGPGLSEERDVAEQIILPDEKPRQIGVGVEEIVLPDERSPLEAIYHQTSKFEPERAARVLELSQKLGEPPSFVDTNLEELEKKVKAPTSSFLLELERNYPGTAKYLSKPENMAVSQNEIEALSQIEKQVRLIGDSSVPDDLARAGQTGWNNLLASAHILRAIYGQATPEEAAQAVSQYHTRAQELSKLKPDYAREFDKAMDQEGTGVTQAFRRIFGKATDNRRIGVLQALRYELPLEILDMLGQALGRPKGVAYSTTENLANSAPSLVSGYSAGAVGAAAGSALPGVGTVAGFTVGMGVGTFMGALPVEVGSQVIESITKRGYDVANPEDLTRALKNSELMTEVRAEAERKGITTAAVDSLFNAASGHFLSKAIKTKGVAGKAKAFLKDTAIDSSGEALSEGLGQAAREKDIAKVDAGEAVLEGIVSAGQSAATAAGSGVMKGLLGKEDQGDPNRPMRDVTPTDPPDGGAGGVPVISEAQTDDARQKLLPSGREEYAQDIVEASEEVLQDTHAAMKAQRSATALENIAMALAQAPITAQDPKRVQDLIEAQYPNGAPKSLFVSRAEWDAYWSKKGLSPVKAVEQILGDGRSYYSADLPDSLIEFPLSVFLSRVALTEHFKGLLPLTRTDLDSQSLEEAETFLTGLPEILSALSDEAALERKLHILTDEALEQDEPDTRENARQAVAALADQIEAAGQPREAALILAEQLHAEEQAGGLSPQEIMDQFPLVFRRGETVQIGDSQPETVTGTPPEGEAAEAIQAIQDRDEIIGGLEAELRTNPLTGIANKRQYLEDLEKPGVGAVAMIDIDAFKKVNDTLGHTAADELLKTLGGYLKTLTGDGSRVRFYHWGGDEFSAIFKNPADAAPTLQALRRKVFDTDYWVVDKQGNRKVYEGISLSVGFGKDEREADQALYQDKEGRLALGEKEDSRTPGPAQRVRDASAPSARGGMAPRGSDAQGNDPVRDRRGGGREGGRRKGDKRPLTPSQIQIEEAPLEGLPKSSPGPNLAIRQAAKLYAMASGIPMLRQKTYVPVDPTRGARLAEAYEAMEHDPDNAQVAESYRAFIDETLAQFQVVKQIGLTVEIIQGENPYTKPSDVLEDIARGHLWLYPTESGFGSINETSTHPLLQKTGEFIGNYELTANDVFRIVHDVFGHAKEGVGFGPNGEENAWQSHVRMYSPLAAQAMTTETRGQNSWVNYGPHGDKNQKATQEATVYADQKAGLLPEWAWTDGLAPNMEVEPVLEEMVATEYGVDPLVLEQARIQDKPETILYEAIPSTKLKHKIGDKKAFSKEALKMFRDDILKALGLQGTESYPTLGGYENVINPSGVTQLGRVDPKTLELAMKTIQYVFRQDEVLSASLEYEQGNNAAVFEFGETPDEGVLGPFFDALASQVDEKLGFFVLDSGQVVVLNTAGVKDFPKAISAFRHKYGEKLKIKDGALIGAKVGSVKHDWEKDPEGKDLRDAIVAAGPSDLQDRLSHWRDAYQGLLEKHQEKLTLNQPAISPLGFYLQLEREVEKMDFKEMPAKDLANRIKNIQGIKADELEALGILDWLNAVPGRIAKKDVLQFIQNRGPMVEQIILSDDFQNAKVPRLLPESRGEGDLPLDFELSWDDGEIQEPSDDYLESQTDLYINDYAGEGFRDDEHGLFGDDWSEKADEIFRDELLDDKDFVLSYDKDEDGDVADTVKLTWEGGWPTGAEGVNFGKGEAGKRRLKKFVEYLEKELTDAFTDQAMDEARERYYDDHDFAEWSYTERETGWTLTGSPGDGEWFSPDTSKYYRGSIAEAQIQLLDDMLAQGVIETQEMRDARIAELENDGEPVPGVRYNLPIGPEPAPGVNAPKGPSRFTSYVSDRLPQLKKLREIVLTSPQAKDYSGEYGGHDHYRYPKQLVSGIVGEYRDPQGRIVMALLETQSDRHALIRKLKLKLQSLTESLGKMAPDAPERADAQEKIQVLQKQIESISAPFENTEAWLTLMVKNLLRIAVQEGYDVFAWAPAELIAQKWGTGQISWVKKGSDKYVILGAAMEETGTEFDTLEQAQAHKEANLGMHYSIQEPGIYYLIGTGDPEQVERRGGRGIRTENELREALESHTENPNIAAAMWKQMQSGEPSGTKMPRKEGFEFEYDNLLPKKVLPNILKKLDKNAKVTVGPSADPDGPKVWQVVITDQMREKILGEGMSLFQDPSDPRGEIRVQGNQIDINMLEKADFSTGVHELSHFMFIVMERLVRMGKASRRMTEHYHALLSLLGAQPGQKLTPEQHEVLAGAFEAFVMKGVAPNDQLRMAFEKYAGWMSNVYKQSKVLGIKLSPAMEDIFQRMLATEEEFEQIETQRGMRPMLDNPEEAGMPPEMAAIYEREKEAAKEYRETQVRKRLMAEAEKKRRKEYRERKKQIREAVDKEVSLAPVYRAISVLRHGKNPDGSPVARELEGVKISKPALKQGYPADLIRKLPRGITAKDGMPVEIVAEAFGFTSATEFLTALSEAPDKTQLINRLTEERIAAEHPDLLHTGEISQEAIEAFHNEHRAQMLWLEWEFLTNEKPGAARDVMRKVARRPLAVKEVRRIAKSAVSARKVHEVKPHLFLRLEVKASREAAQAFAKGDREAAAEAKGRELMNHELYRAAVEAKETIEKALEKFDRVNRSDEKLSRSRDINMVQAARAVLAFHGLGRSEKPPQSYLAQLQNYDPETYKVISAMVARATSNAKPYQELSFTEFEELKNTVDALWQLAKSHNEIVLEGRRLTREEAISELKAAISDIVGDRSKKQDYDRAATKWERTLLYLMGSRANLRRVEQWTDAMDLGNFQGPFRQILLAPVLDATSQYRLEKVKRLEQLLSILKPIESTLNEQKILSPELNYEFSGKAELIGALVHIGNPSNFQKLLRGYGWGDFDYDGNLDSSKWDAFFKRATAQGLITKADMDVVQGIWNLFEELKPALQAAHKEMFGYYFAEVTAAPVETPWGSYRGGYAPAKADPFKSEDASIKAEKNEIEGQNDSWSFPSAGRGSTLSRVEQYAAPLQMNLRFLGTHLDWALRFTFIQPSVKQTAGIVLDPEFRKALAELDPTAASDMLVPWLQRAATQKVQFASKGWGGRAADLFFRELRRRTGLQIMFANVTNTLQQFTGFSIAALKVPPKNLRNALWQYVQAPKEVMESISDKSDFMKTRVATQVFDIQQQIEDMLLNPNKYDELRAYMQKNGYALQALTQSVVDTVVWLGAYEQALEQTESEAEAVKMADSAVRSTQGSFNPEDVSSFETGSALKRFFTMFYSYFNMQANTVGTEFVKIARLMGLKKGAGRGLYIYVMGLAVPFFLAELIVRAMGGKLDEDDDEQYLDDVITSFFSSQVRGATAMIPVVGPAAQVAVNRWNKTYWDDRISVSPAVSMIESSVSAPYSVYQAIFEDGSKKKAVKDALSCIGMLTGVPVLPVAKPTGYLIDVLEGKASPSGPIDFTRGLISGKSGE